MTLAKSRVAIDPRCDCGEPIPWPPLDPARVPAKPAFDTSFRLTCWGCAEGTTDLREPWSR